MQGHQIHQETPNEGMLMRHMYAEFHNCGSGMTRSSGAGHCTPCSVRVGGQCTMCSVQAGRNTTECAMFCPSVPLLPRLRRVSLSHPGKPSPCPTPGFRGVLRCGPKFARFGPTQTVPGQSQSTWLKRKHAVSKLLTMALEFCPVCSYASCDCGQGARHTKMAVKSVTAAQTQQRASCSQSGGNYEQYAHKSTRL